MHHVICPELILKKTITTTKYLFVVRPVILMPTLSLSHPIPVFKNNQNSRYWQRNLVFASQWLFPHMIQWKRIFYFMRTKDSSIVKMSSFMSSALIFLILWGFKQFYKIKGKCQISWFKSMNTRNPNISSVFVCLFVVLLSGWK